MKRLAAAVALLTVLAALLIQDSQTPAVAQAGCEMPPVAGRVPAEALFTIAVVAPLPCVFISDGSVVESNSEAAVEFRIHTTLPRDFSYFVNYSTESVSAVAGQDFVAVSGTVALSLGSPSVLISVPVIGDSVFEPDEVFHVNLTTDGEGFRIEDGRGVGTIVNDDPAPPGPPPAPAPPPAPVPDGVTVPSPEPTGELPPPPVFTVPTPTSPTSTPPAASASPAPSPSGAAPVRGRGQTVSVRAAGGGTQAPPGGALDLSAGGFASCSQVLFLLDGVRIGSLVPSPDGSASIDGVSVPGDAKPGAHSVSARCDGPGFGAPRTRLTVTSPPVHRTALVTSLPQPWQVPVDAVSIGISLLAALAMIVLVAIPAELFNSTLEENNAEVRALLHLPARRREPRQPLSPAATFTLFVLVGGFLYALLSPGFGPDASSFALVVGMTVALAVTTAGFAFPQGVYMRRRFGDSGRLSVVPATLVVSTVFVILSLAVRLNPGLIYGVVAGFAFRNALAEDEEGRLAAGTTVFLLLVCLTAWFTRAAISDLAAGPDAGFMILAVEAALAGVVLVGLESLTIGLIPLRALNGRKIANWSFPAWMAVFTITTAAFVHILLTPSSGYVSPLQGRSGVIFLCLAGLLAAGAVAFWAYFQFREPRREP
jgi:hypothetical protein